MKSLLAERDGRVTLVLPRLFTRAFLEGRDFDSLPDTLPSTITIDFSNLESCDSAGVAALVWLGRALRRQGGSLRWHELPERVATLFALYDLNEQEWINDAGTTD